MSNEEQPCKEYFLRPNAFLRYASGNLCGSAQAHLHIWNVRPCAGHLWRPYVSGELPMYSCRRERHAPAGVCLLRRGKTQKKIFCELRQLSVGHHNRGNTQKKVFCELRQLTVGHHNRDSTQRKIFCELRQLTVRHHNRGSRQKKIFCELSQLTVGHHNRG